MLPKRQCVVFSQNKLEMCSCGWPPLKVNVGYDFIIISIMTSIAIAPYMKHLPITGSYTQLCTL